MEKKFHSFAFFQKKETQTGYKEGNPAIQGQHQPTFF